MQETIARYIDVWNDEDHEIVKAMLAHSCAADVTYTYGNVPTYTSDEVYVLKGIDTLTSLVMNSNARMCSP